MAEKIMLQIRKGAFVPADAHAVRRIRERGYKVGNIVAAEIRKPRSPGFNRYAHALGALVVDNIDGFEALDGHRAIKRLQLEAGIECEEIAYQVPGHGTVVQRIPKSIAFESLDEGRFRDLIYGIAKHISTHYWPSESPESVIELAKAMPPEAV